MRIPARLQGLALPPARYATLTDALAAAAASDTGLDVEIGRPGEDAVDATSILGVMALGAKHGEEVVLTAEGDGADAALDGLVELLSRDLDAE